MIDSFVSVTFDAKLGGKLPLNDKTQPIQEEIQRSPKNSMIRLISR
ncbi:MAG: hypothetical protein ACSI46_23070 [Gloeotrichia echinulata DVL01]